MKKKYEGLINSSKNIISSIEHLYLKKIKKWMYCPECKSGIMSINSKKDLWQCEDCGYALTVEEFESDCIFWFCDECDLFLNSQEGFNENTSKWICTKCGYENDTTENNIKGICIDCGKIIPDSQQTLCTECKLIRKEKAKENLKKAAKVVGVVAAAAILEASLSENNSNDVIETAVYNDNENQYLSPMSCANCGNADEESIWDEGDTIYCSICHHRTLKATSCDDVVECPYCHRMRDRKAMYCRHCNDSAWLPSTDEEFKEIDEMLKEIGH